jgi:hypothetical protein
MSSFFINFIISVRGGHYDYSPRDLRSLATPLFTVHFKHFVYGKDKNMETTKGLITFLSMLFILLHLQRVGPTRNNIELYLQISNTVTDPNATKLPARVTPIAAVF